MNINKETLMILDKLNNNGHEAYIVGGSVRDIIQGRQPKDWDICTSARPEETMKIFSDVPVIETGLKHGTVTVVLNKQPTEITTYRVDGEYEKNRYPKDVKFTSSLKEDLARRDFTINAMAYSPESGLIDFFGGKSDIERGILRSVGNPKLRMEEDGLRILRALRFISEYSYRADSNLSHAIHKKKDLLKNISAERISCELNKILLGNDVKKALLDYSDVISVFIPEISPMIGMEQNNPYHYLDVWEHTVEAVSVSDKDVTVRLALLLHDIGKPSCYSEKNKGHFYGHPEKSATDAAAILNRLKYDNHTKSTLKKIITWHDVKIEHDKILKWLNKLGEKNFRLLLKVQNADILAQHKNYRNERIKELQSLEEELNKIIEEKKCFKIEDLAIDGKDIIAMGYTEGKEIGAKLNFLLDAVLENNVENSRKKLIEYLKYNSN